MRQASIGGTETRVFFRVAGVALWLSALILPVLGFWAWSTASEGKSDTERLRRAGRPATAEILSVELLEFADDPLVIASLNLRVEAVPRAR